MSELTPQVPHSLPRERLIPFSSPVQTSVPLRLRATWSHLGGVKMRSLMTACHWLHQMERSCCARSMTLPSLSLANPASLSQAWMPNFSASCAVDELGLEWSLSCTHQFPPLACSDPLWKGSQSTSLRHKLSHRSLLLSHLGRPGTQSQPCQERIVFQPMDIVPGNSFRLGPNEGYGHAWPACSGHIVARGLLRNRSLFPSQIVSENAGPHDLHVPSVKIGPASYAAPSTLAETEDHGPSD